MNDSLRITVSIKGVAKLFQLLAEFEVVVDLAVENDPAVTVITGHGLLTSRREINDAQPVMA
jgi:hypothetical protein